MDTDSKKPNETSSAEMRKTLEQVRLLRLEPLGTGLSIFI